MVKTSDEMNPAGEFGLVLNVFHKFPSDHSLTAEKQRGLSLSRQSQLAYRDALSILEQTLYIKEAGLAWRRVRASIAKLDAIDAVVAFEMIHEPEKFARCLELSTTANSWLL